MFKKLVMVVLTVVAIGTGLAVGLNKPVEARAAGSNTIAYSKAERNVLKGIIEVQDEYDECSEKEKKIITGIDCSYTELTEYGIYDIVFVFHIKNELHEIHVIYDGEEDEELTTYVIGENGERVDIYDWEDAIEEKYPEIEMF